MKQLIHIATGLAMLSFSLAHAGSMVKNSQANPKIFAKTAPSKDIIAQKRKLIRIIEKKGEDIVKKRDQFLAKKNWFRPASVIFGDSGHAISPNKLYSLDFAEEVANEEDNALYNIDIIKNGVKYSLFKGSNSFVYFTPDSNYIVVSENYLVDLQKERIFHFGKELIPKVNESLSHPSIIAWSPDGKSFILEFNDCYSAYSCDLSVSELWEIKLK